MSVALESGYFLKQLEKSIRARRDSFITRIFTEEVNRSSTKFLNSYLPKPLNCKGKVADPKKWPNDILEHYKKQFHRYKFFYHRLFHLYLLPVFY